MQSERPRGLVVHALVAVAALLATAAPGRAGELLTEAGGQVTSGDYGGADRVDVWESYLRIGYAYSRVSVAVTLPVIHVDGPGVPTGGGIVPVAEEDPAPTTTGGPAGPGARGEEDDETMADATGLGDVRVELRVVAVDEGPWWPAVSLVGEVKAPTANPDRGLGTGEWDAGGGLTLSKLLFDRLQLRADLRAVVIGEPPEAELEPVVFSAELSAGWTIAMGRDVALTPFVFAAAQTRIAADVEPPVEVGGGAWLAVGRFVVGLSTAVGLTDGSPDLAVGLSVSLAWPEVGPAE